MLAFAALLRFTKNVSSASLSVSPLTFTTMFLLLSPGRSEERRVGKAYSLGGMAVPYDVEKVTVNGWLLAPAKVTVKTASTVLLLPSSTLASVLFMLCLPLLFRIVPTP